MNHSLVFLTKLVGAVMVLAAISACSSVPRSNPNRIGLFDRWGALKRSPGSVAEFDVRAWEKVKIVWPLKAVEITSPYGQRDRKFHQGVDLRARIGTPVYAAHDGVVTFAGRGMKAYGRMVMIRSGGLTTIYAHNSRVTAKTNQRIKAGELIAYSGQSGRATGPHLHFEIREGITAIDPVWVMEQVAHQAAPTYSRNIISRAPALERR